MRKEFLGLYEEDVFQKDSFLNPDVQYAPIYVWMWNGKVNHEETDRQLEEMKRLGIKSMYILPEPKSFRPNTMPTMLEPDYLTKAYFEEFLYATKKAAEMGMTMWLYDEGGWPSGGACGKVLLEYPEYARKILSSKKTIDSDGKEKKEYFSETLLFANPGNPDFPDLTREEATKAFIEIGLESYKPYLEPYFGKEITFVFTDEPAMPRPIPFRKEMEKLFEQRNGYSIKPYLQELSGDKLVQDEKAAKARIDWYDMCSDLFCENFLMLEKEWANQNGMAFTGHFGGEDQIIYNLSGGYGNIMRALRCLDVPGIDAIWRQIYPMERPSDFHPVTGISGENRIFPRFASSAAAQTRKHLVMTESCGVYGAGLTFAEMRFIFNYQAIRGVNIFNLFSVPYAREGFLMTGELPFITEKHACYKDLPSFNAYLERLSYVASLGQTDHKVALYMPIWDIWAGERSKYYNEMFDKVGKELEDQHIMFDVFDDDVLKCADMEFLQKGIVAMGDVQYSILVLPPCKYMPESNVEKLECFIAGGGTVFMVSCEEMPEIYGAKIVESIKGQIVPQLQLSGNTDFIRVGSRKLANGKAYFLHNEGVSKDAFEVEMDQMEAGNLYLLDLYNGKITIPCLKQGKLKLHLESGEMAVVFNTDAFLDAEECVICSKEYCVLENFKFSRSNRFVISEKTYESIDIQEECKETVLGDWSFCIGKEFSGSCIYETKFRLNDCDNSLCLDLGEVHYTCEVFLNGQSLGVRVMAPYIYELPKDLLREENALKIRVSNTPANEYNYTKSFDKWAKWQLSPYWEKEKIFHEDSLSGGLYGPVRILERV